jgi:hypothetical protein
MASNRSKHTIALLASYPTFQEWVVKNLTLSQIDTVCNSPRFEVSLPMAHPLGDEKFAAGVFRAYRSEVVWLIKSQYESLEDFDMMRGGQETFDALYHHALITAIAFMTDESPEVLQQVVDDREAASGG